MKLDDQGLALKRESPTEIAFALTHGIGWMFILGGAGLAWAATRAYRGTDLLMVAGFCLLSVVVGIVVLLYRAEFRIDLVSGRYRFVRGFVFNPSKLEGGLEDFEELRLLVVRRMLEDSFTMNVVIALSIRGQARALNLFETGNLEHAHAVFRRLATTLRVKATDETDRSFQPEGEGQWELPEPIDVSPAQGRIQLDVSPRRHVISLPRDRGVRLLFFAGFFGCSFLFMGLLVVGTKLGLVQMKYSESPPGIGWFLGPLFTLIGAAACFAGFYAWFVREESMIEGDSFVCYQSAFGLRFQARSVRKSDVTRIELRTSLAEDDDRKEKLPIISGRFRLKRPSLRQEVSVEGENFAIRLGSRLTREELFWLRDFLRGQLTPRMRSSGSGRRF